MRDKRFATPMVICNAGHIFVGDFILYHTADSLIKAKVSLFFKKVLITVNAHIRFRLPCLFSPMQESSEEIFVTVIPLKPETDEIYLILDEEIISDNDIESAASPPLCFKKWDDPSSSYRQLSPEVRYNKHKCPRLKVYCTQEYASFTVPHYLKSTRTRCYITFIFFVVQINALCWTCLGQ